MFSEIASPDEPNSLSPVHSEGASLDEPNFYFLAVNGRRGQAPTLPRIDKNQKWHLPCERQQFNLSARQSHF